MVIYFHEFLCLLAQEASVDSTSIILLRMDKGHNKDKSWIGDIRLAETGLAGTMTYIDRMVGHSNPQYALYRRHMQQNQKNRDNKKGAPNKRNFKVKQPFSNKISPNVDDVAWLADRRKKFPKFGSEEKKTDEEERELPKFEKTKENKRKRTLFEKLLDES